MKRLLPVGGFATASSDFVFLALICRHITGFAVVASRDSAAIHRRVGLESADREGRGSSPTRFLQIPSARATPNCAFPEAEIESTEVLGDKTLPNHIGLLFHPRIPCLSQIDALNEGRNTRLSNLP